MSDARDFDRDAEESKADAIIKGFTCEQRDAFDKIDSPTSKGDGGFYFVTGPGGTGKTRVAKVLSIVVVFVCVCACV